MPDLHKLRKVTRLPLVDKPAKAPLYPLQVGMPAIDSIHDDSVTFKGGRKNYQILKTAETDTYENSEAAQGFRAAIHGVKKPDPAAIAAAAAKPPSVGDDFAGTDRKASKMSIGTGKMETFADVSKVIATLPTGQQMEAMNIPTDANSGRTAPEQRNVHVTGFLYACSREADNDFHLVVGRDPKASGPPMYMTMEVSGLPPANFPSFAKMNAARTAFKTFFGANLPGAGYDYYSTNPIPVVVEGSLFWDATHSTGQAPGPPSLKPHMPTIWEVHPVTSIKLG